MQVPGYRGQTVEELTVGPESSTLYSPLDPRPDLMGKIGDAIGYVRNA